MALGDLAARAYGVLFVSVYDRLQAHSESEGMCAMRATLVHEAKGRTVELGAGTGLNLDHFPRSASPVVASEPDPSMLQRLQERRSALSRCDIALLRTSAEKLPFPSGSVDTVVATMVLCTATDPAAVLREVARVLAPGGRFLFLEHVRASGGVLALAQRALAPLWRIIGRGCRCDQDVARLLRDSPLRIERLESGMIPRAVPLVSPMVTGIAAVAHAPDFRGGDLS